MEEQMHRSPTRSSEPQIHIIEFAEYIAPNGALRSKVTCMGGSFSAPRDLVPRVDD